MRTNKKTVGVEIPKAQSQLNEIRGTLKTLGLLAEHKAYPNYASFGIAALRGLQHRDIWSTCLSSGFYDFRLSDSSLLQFRIPVDRAPEATYSFYEVPFAKEFLDRERFDEEVSEDGADRDEATLQQLYDLYIDALPIKHQAISIRYDWSPNAYSPGSHPASHVHIGVDNSIRIGTKRVLYPISFTLLVLRQCYPAHWQRFVELEDSTILCRNIRDGLQSVDAMFFRPVDRHEMILD